MCDDFGNTASDLLKESLVLWGDNEASATLREGMTEDFVREDRRRIVATPSLGREDWIKALSSWSNLGAGDATFNMGMVHAVRGERLCLCEVKANFPDGSEVVALVITQLDGMVQRCERAIQFDHDDLESAVAELDKLHADIHADHSR